MKRVFFIFLLISTTVHSEPRGGAGNANGEEINGDVEIIESTNPQLTLTHTPSVNYTDLQTTTTGDLQIDNSGIGTRFLDVISIGAVNPLARRDVTTRRTQTTADTTNYASAFFENRYNHPSGTFTATQTNLTTVLTNQNAGTIANAASNLNSIVNNSSGSITLATGVFGKIANTSIGTIGDARGIYSNVSNSGTGTLTNGTGVYIARNINTGGGTFVNNYGLYVEDQYNATNNYAIYTNDGDVRLGDDLEVVGDIKQTLHIDDVSNPPTDAELDAIFGTPATVGAGFTTYLDDNGAETDVYHILSTGTKWFIFTGAEAS